MRSQVLNLWSCPAGLRPTNASASNDNGETAVSAKTLQARWIQGNRPSRLAMPLRERTFGIAQGVCRAQVADHTKKCNQCLADMFGEGSFKMKAVIRDPLLSIRDADLICRYQAAQVRKDRPCRLEAEKTSGPARRGACQEDRLAAKRAFCRIMGIDSRKPRHPVHRILQVGGQVPVIFRRCNDKSISCFESGL